MTAVHKFIKNGIPIVLDVASGAVHVTDKLAFRILDFYPGHNDEGIIDSLKNEFNAADIAEGLEEIKKRIKLTLFLSFFPGLILTMSDQW